VVLGIEKHRHTAEIQVKSRNAVLSGTQETGDLYASIREVAEKLERQALKHKEKLYQRKQRKGTRKPAGAAAAGTSEPPVEAGPDESAGVGARVVRSQRYRLKPLSLEDAVLDMEATGEELLVYRDAQSNRINVLYRQKDGTMELVEPEF
jgi:putative sigma-54 modulation protein